MPKVTVWIRVDDVKTWQSIVDRPEWIHVKLNEERDKRQEQADRQISLTAPHLRPAPRKRPLDDVMALLEPAERPFAPRPPDPEVGYPCCQKTQPCKHWHFDGTSGLWTNELTKKTREAV